MSKRNSTYIPPNKGKRLPAEPLTMLEATALVKAASARAPTGKRNRALLSVLYRSGLRCNEALSLRVADVDPAAGTVRVLHGKGDKPRTVGLDPGALAVVEKWLSVRRTLPRPRGALFSTLAGEPMSTAYCRAMVKRLAKRAGIAKRVHPHGLRHTHAAELAREGVPMNVIRDQLGHTSLATTDTYLRGLCPADVITTMQARIWTL